MTESAAGASGDPTSWMVPNIWNDQTAVCIGGGPSLTPAQVDYCRGRARVIAINDAYRLAPWADVLYACDHKWWTWHPAALAFSGEKVTQDLEAWRAFPVLRWIHGERYEKGLSRVPNKIHCGRNSGYQAINLAYLLGARRIVLIGYDMRIVGDRTHWFGDHPSPLESDYGVWLRHFRTIADELPSLEIEIVNCTPGSALTCFPIGNLEKVIP